MHLFLKITNLIANNCIKLLLLTSEQNLCEMALVKNAARNGAVCDHHDSKEIFVLLCLFFPEVPRSMGVGFIVSHKAVTQQWRQHLGALLKVQLKCYSFNYEYFALFDRVFEYKPYIHNKKIPNWITAFCCHGNGQTLQILCVQEQDLKCVTARDLCGIK